MNMLYSILDPNLENLYFQPENSLLTLVQGKSLESNRFSIAKNAYVGIAPKAIGQAVPFVPTITGSQCTCISSRHAAEVRLLLGRQKSARAEFRSLRLC